MKDFLRTLVGLLIVIVLITLVYIPIFNQNKDMGLEAVSDMAEFKGKIRGDSVDGIVVLQYLRMDGIDVEVENEDGHDIANPEDWVEESASFSMRKEYNENGLLDEVTFRRIDKSRVER